MPNLIFLAKRVTFPVRVVIKYFEIRSIIIDKSIIFVYNSKH